MAFRQFRFSRRRRAPLGVGESEVLSEANRLLARGCANEAAPLFAQLAQNLEQGGHPRRAANLHARAAHAYADAGEEDSALLQARAALTHFISLNMARRTRTFYANIGRKMQARGMASALATLRREFEGSAGASAPGDATATSARQAHLPGVCPHCGAAARTDEVYWIDAQSAECAYCGGVIQAVE